MTGKNKRSIKHGDVPPYLGESQIVGYYEAAYDIINRKVRCVEKVQPCPFPEDSQRHFLTLWMGGPREQEALMLHPDGYKWNDRALVYYNMPVLKKREKMRDKEGHVIYREVPTKVIQQDGSIEEQIVYRPMTKRKIEYRDVVIPVEIPLFQEFIELVQSLKDQGYEYMLYKMDRFTRNPHKDKATTTRTIQNRINELHPDLFPHLLRPLHARFLRSYFRKKGQRFDGPEIKEYFKWSTLEMADLYLGAGKIAELMGIDELPR